MTYHVYEMNNKETRYGRPWSKGTFRVYHNDDRQCWSVTEPGDKYYSTAFGSWYNHGGEFFDGEKWCSMTEYHDWAISKGRTRI